MSTTTRPATASATTAREARRAQVVATSQARMNKAIAIAQAKLRFTHDVAVRAVIYAKRGPHTLPLIEALREAEQQEWIERMVEANLVWENACRVYEAAKANVTYADEREVEAVDTALKCGEYARQSKEEYQLGLNGTIPARLAGEPEAMRWLEEDAIDSAEHAIWCQDIAVQEAASALKAREVRAEARQDVELAVTAMRAVSSEHLLPEMHVIVCADGEDGVIAVHLDSRRAGKPVERIPFSTDSTTNALIDAEIALNDADFRVVRGWQHLGGSIFIAVVRQHA